MIKNKIHLPDSCTNKTFIFPFNPGPVLIINFITIYSNSKKAPVDIKSLQPR